MSFLNSVMSSIGEGQSNNKAAPPPQRLAPSSNKPVGTSSVGRNSTAASASLQRKTDERNGAQALKAPSTTVSRSVSPALVRSKTASPAQRTGIAPPPAAAQAYKGTSRPSGASLATTTTANKLPSSSVAPKSTTTSSSAASTAPKKGYLAILERAKAAQEAAKPLGQIKHQKTVEKDRLSRKERERRAAEAAAAAKSERRAAGRTQVSSAGGSRTSSTTRDAQTADPKKRKVEVAYKGTMRPVPAAPAYTGTMRSGGSSQASRPSAKTQPKRNYVEDYSDEEDDDDMNDYESDVSSDMEAGIDEVEKEEMLSVMQAKREDEEAMREENELKRAKLERKRKLEMLNAAAAKKKKIY